MRKILRKFGLLTVVGLAFSATATGARADTPASEDSYPYDPTCPWGRISNGKGMLLRCLSVAEAKVLAGSKLEGGKLEGANLEGKLEKEKVKKDAEKANTPTAESDADLTASDADEPELAVEVDPVKADKGEFPGAKLNVPATRARYLACIDKNGGISQATAEVVVRFLVRDLERAEGVSVKSFKGMSKQAARCVADVIDRRHIGDPEGELMGASVRLAFSMKTNASAAEQGTAEKSAAERSVAETPLAETRGIEKRAQKSTGQRSVGQKSAGQKSPK